MGLPYGADPIAYFIPIAVFFNPGPGPPTLHIFFVSLVKHTLQRNTVLQFRVRVLENYILVYINYIEIKRALLNSSLLQLLQSGTYLYIITIQCFQPHHYFRSQTFK